MHLVMILLVLAIAFLIRLLRGLNPSREQLWTYFLLPPLLILSTALAIVAMGPAGEMLGFPASWLSYLLAWGYLLFSLAVFCHRSYQMWQQRQKLAQLKSTKILEQSVYLLETDFPYGAQVGLWRSQLLISRGLWELLTPEELTAVFAHETAHAYYHDNFCFFCLGCLRRCTAWLPYTETLWQEMLWERELRADSWSINQVDSLVLAQALLRVGKKVNEYLQQQPDLIFVMELDGGNHRRLIERIELLLSLSEPTPPPQEPFSSLTLSLLPLLTILLHH